MAEKKLNRKKRKWVSVLSVIGFTVCALALLYPVISDAWNRYRDSKLILDYYQEYTDGSHAEENQQMLEEAQAYNRELAEKTTSVITEAEYEKDEAYESLLNGSGKGLMGYIEIPCIDCTEPIYHYSSDDVLAKGVGHIHGSSLPAGGSSAHCVLTGHRGLPGQKFFTDLDQVKVGDKFYLHVLDQTLAYEVNDIRTVRPEEVENLRIEEGKDLVTLVTCTPYGINTHRLLITGHRVPYSEGTSADGMVTAEKHHRRLEPALLIFYGFVLVIIVLVVIRLVQKHKKKSEAPHEN